MVTTCRPKLRLQFNCMALVGFMLLAFAPVSHSETGSAQAVKKKSQQQIVQELLAQEERPTVQDLLRAFPNLPSQNPFRAMAVSSVPGSHIGTVAQDGPQLVADLEATYPGAVFAFLGRDSALTADIVEAYFLSRGQHGRVARLNASSGSFGEGNHEYDILMAAGLCGPKPSKNDRFVILDATPYEASPGARGRVSQSRRLISAYYKRASGQGHDLTELVRRVNVIGLGSNSRRNGEIISASTLETYFVTTNASPSTGPEKILYATGQFTYLPMDYANQEIVWHGKFGSLQRQADGKFVASRGEKTSDTFRAHVLADMYDVVIATRTSQFHERVEQDLQSLRAKPISDVARVHVPAFVLDEALVDQAWSAETIISQWAEAREAAPHAYAFALDRRALELAWSTFERDPTQMPPAQLAAVIETVLKNAELPLRTFSFIEARIKGEGALSKERDVLMSKMHEAAEAGLRSALKKVNSLGNRISDLLQRWPNFKREALAQLRDSVARWAMVGTIWAAIIGGTGYVTVMKQFDTGTVAPVVAAELSKTASIAEDLTLELAATKSMREYYNALLNASNRVDGKIWGRPQAVYFDKALLATVDHLRSLEPYPGFMEYIYEFAKDWSTRRVLAEVALAEAKQFGDYSTVGKAFSRFSRAGMYIEFKSELERESDQKVRVLEESRFIADNASEVLRLYLKTGSRPEDFSHVLVTQEYQMRFIASIANDETFSGGWRADMTSRLLNELLKDPHQGLGSEWAKIIEGAIPQMMDQGTYAQDIVVLKHPFAKASDWLRIDRAMLPQLQGYGEIVQSLEPPPWAAAHEKEVYVRESGQVVLEAIELLAKKGAKPPTAETLAKLKQMVPASAADRIDQLIGTSPKSQTGNKAPTTPLVPVNGQPGAQPKMRSGSGGAGALRPKRACSTALNGVSGQ